MNSSLDNVYELLRLGYGDTYRLEDIKQRLENGKVLYASDNDYLQKLVYQYREKIQKVVEHKKPKPTPEPTRIPEPEPTLPKKKSSKKKKVGIVFGVLILFYFVFNIFNIGGVADVSTSVTVDVPVISSQEERAELINSAITWTYKDVVRNPEKYSGEVLGISGQVKYVSDRGNDRYWLAMEKKCGSHPYNLICDYAIVDYTGQRILQGDNISSYGYLDKLSKAWPQGNPSPVIKSILLECTNCN